ncbi:hypothetical protein IC607_02530 [Cellulomonas sp. JH27-2]|uniref:hypothetical protein n=1 Tax=Cellulomonas sp. JH27-2 TaxID=2774139 RepID=UPI0017817FBD|nr:hypothetical protein [Cellulomonas sp. JH27-2]MBD8057842.1 hypothetical protein [Cellulomonas sp. JH27-2]
MALRFRNFDATPADLVERWGVEGCLTAVERGEPEHWAKIVRAVEVDPMGAVSLDLEQALRVLDESDEEYRRDLVSRSSSPSWPTSVPAAALPVPWRGAVLARLVRADRVVRDGAEQGPAGGSPRGRAWSG